MTLTKGSREAVLNKISSSHHHREEQPIANPEMILANARKGLRAKERATMKQEGTLPPTEMNLPEQAEWAYTKQQDKQRSEAETFKRQAARDFTDIFSKSPTYIVSSSRAESEFVTILICNNIYIYAAWTPNGPRFSLARKCQVCRTLEDREDGKLRLGAEFYDLLTLRKRLHSDEYNGYICKQCTEARERE